MFSIVSRAGKVAAGTMQNPASDTAAVRPPHDLVVSYDLSTAGGPVPSRLSFDLIAVLVTADGSGFGSDSVISYANSSSVHSAVTVNVSAPDRLGQAQQLELHLDRVPVATTQILIIAQGNYADGGPVPFRDLRHGNINIATTDGVPLLRLPFADLDESDSTVVIGEFYRTGSSSWSFQARADSGKQPVLADLL